MRLAAGDVHRGPRPGGQGDWLAVSDDLEFEFADKNAEGFCRRACVHLRRPTLGRNFGL